MILRGTNGKEIVVPNFRANNVSIVDLEKALAGDPGAEVARIPLTRPADADNVVRPSRPKGSAVTSDGRYAVISGGGRTTFVPSGTVWVIDLRTRGVVGTVTGVGNDPYGPGRARRRLRRQRPRSSASTIATSQLPGGSSWASSHAPASGTYAGAYAVAVTTTVQARLGPGPRPPSSNKPSWSVLAARSCCPGHLSATPAPRTAPASAPRTCPCTLQAGSHAATAHNASRAKRRPIDPSTCGMPRRALPLPRPGWFRLSCGTVPLPPLPTCAGAGRDRPFRGRLFMAGLLEGKVAIVTGAGGGIGREHALTFAREGAKVVVNDLGSDRHGGGKGAEMADQTVADIKAAGGEATANYDSVATREGADGILWTALNKYGRVDVLVNNAGILRDKTLLNMSEQDFDLVIDVHLRGTFLCTQAVGRIFKTQGKGGRIVNTTSLSGLLGNFGQGNYAAAKGGIYSLTRTASMEFQRMGVTVNAIAPVALTRMTQDLQMFKGLTGEQIGPQYVAPVAAFLASDLAADITGTIVGVQGPKIFVYKMVETEGVTREGGPWSPAEIKERWGEISKV